MRRSRHGSRFRRRRPGARRDARAGFDDAGPTGGVASERVAGFFFGEALGFRVHVLRLFLSRGVEFADLRSRPYLALRFMRPPSGEEAHLGPLRRPESFFVVRASGREERRETRGSAGLGVQVGDLGRGSGLDIELVGAGRQVGLDGCGTGGEVRLSLGGLLADLCAHDYRT